MKRNSTAVWDGRLKDGCGSLSTESGALRSAPYSFATCFERQLGTNPEELLAAALAGSFSMALSGELENSKLAATQIEIRASVGVDRTDDRWTIHEMELFLKADLAGAASIPFLVAASRAKSNCPVARAFAAQVRLHTELAGRSAGEEPEAEVVIYTSTYCQVCGQAKSLLERQGIRYREVDLDQEPGEMASALKLRTGLTSVPQIFAGEHFIGTYHDLIQLDADHGLRSLLRKNDLRKVS